MPPCGEKPKHEPRPKKSSFVTAAANAQPSEQPQKTKNRPCRVWLSAEQNEELVCRITAGKPSAFDATASAPVASDDERRGSRINSWTAWRFTRSGQGISPSLKKKIGGRGPISRGHLRGSAQQSGGDFRFRRTGIFHAEIRRGVKHQERAIGMKLRALAGVVPDPRQHSVIRCLDSLPGKFRA